MRVLDANADPVSGGKYLVQQAGTTTDVTLYAEVSGGSTISNPVVADSTGRVPSAFCDPQKVKISVLNASDVQFAVFDHLDATGEVDKTSLVDLTSDQTVTGAKTMDIVGNASTATALDSTALASAGISDVSGIAATADLVSGTAGKLVDAASLGERCLVSSYAETADTFTTTTQIPTDGTIPQNTEGGEILTASITRKSASSRIRVSGTFLVASSAASVMTVAVFQDSSADAIYATPAAIHSANFVQTVSFSFEIATAATGSTTFKVRVGPNTSVTGYVNRNSVTSDMHGTAGLSTLRVEEIART
jgi:hypothetical protein